MKNPKELEILHDLSGAIVGAMSVDEVCGRIVEKTAALLRVNKVSIMKLDPADGALKIVAAKGLSKSVVRDASVKVGAGISGHVFKSKKPVMINNIGASSFKPRSGYKTKSLMSAPVTCFPMRVGHKPVGVINVTDRKGGKAFDRDDMTVLNTIANQTAAYLHLCDMVELAKKTEHIVREVEIARDIQKKLLPKQVPVIKGATFAGRCITAEHVGGDYFDFLAGGVRPPTVVVADVAGHSIGAAMMMSAFRSAVRSESSIFSPALMAEKLNAILYDDLAASEQFISMVYLQIMSNAGQTAVKYTTAGHYPPLILKGGGFINHATEDVLLGAERFAEYHEKRIDVESGDLIILYTDGLIDALNAGGAAFGFGRLKEIVKRCRRASAQEMVDSICGGVQKFAGKKAFRDDVTVVAIGIE